MKIIALYPTNAVGVLLALVLAGCGDNNPPTGEEVAKALKGRALPGGFGVMTTGYCRPDGTGSYNCVVRTAQGRVACTASRVQDDGRAKRLFCRSLGT